MAKYEIDTTPSDLYLKAMGKWNFKSGGRFEEALLCIRDKSVEFEITGVNETGQWLVKRL